MRLGRSPYSPSIAILRARPLSTTRLHLFPDPDNYHLRMPKRSSKNVIHTILTDCESALDDVSSTVQLTMTCEEEGSVEKRDSSMHL